MSQYFYLNYKITQKNGREIHDNIQLFCDSVDEAENFILEEGEHQKKQLLQQKGLTDYEGTFEWSEVISVREANEEEAL